MKPPPKSEQFASRAFFGTQEHSPVIDLLVSTLTRSHADFPDDFEDEYPPGQLSREIANAIKNLDDTFFEELARAVRELKYPTVTQKDEAIYWAIIFAEEFERRGLRPTKQAIRNRVESIWDARGKKRMNGKQWSRDVWPHPELRHIEKKPKGKHGDK